MSPLRYLYMCLRPMGLDPFHQNRFSNYLKLLGFAGIAYIISPHITNLLVNFNGLISLKYANYLPGLIEVVVKAMVLYIKMPTFGEVDEMIGSFWPLNRFGTDLERRLKLLKDNVLLFAKSYIATSFLSAFVLDLIPLLSKSGKTPISGYNFCDLNTTSCFRLQLLLHSYSIFFVGLPVYVVFDLTFCLFVTHAYSSLEMVKYGYRELNRQLKSEQFKTSLKDVVDQHDLVLRFIRKLESLYSMVFVVIFLGVAAEITLNLYVLTSEGIPPPFHIFMPIGSTLLTINLHLIIYCIGGDLITKQMESVAYVVYDVQWWEVEDSAVIFGKDLRYIMERSQKSEPLTVGKTLKLNLESFVLIQKIAFQIYTLITNLDKKE